MMEIEKLIYQGELIKPDLLVHYKDYYNNNYLKYCVDIDFYLIFKIEEEILLSYLNRYKSLRDIFQTNDDFIYIVDGSNKIVEKTIIKYINKDYLPTEFSFVETIYMDEYFISLKDSLNKKINLINIESLFHNIDIDDEENKEVICSKEVYLKTAKSLFETISYIHSSSFKKEHLREEQFPDESVCDECKGCGIFINDGVETDCYNNPEYGYCSYTHFDSELFIENFNNVIPLIYDLLQYNKLV